MALIQGTAGDDFLPLLGSTDIDLSSTGADVFRPGTPTFGLAARFANSLIAGFKYWDRLDLSGFGYHFIGNAAFTASMHEVRYTFVGTTTVVEVDDDGDGVADGQLTIASGNHALAETGADTMILAIPTVGVIGSHGNDSITFQQFGGPAIFELANSNYFYPASGPRTITVTNTLVSEPAAGINTALSGVSFITIDTRGLPALPAGQVCTVDASALVDSNATLIAGDAAHHLIGGASTDTFETHGGQVTIEGNSFDGLWLYLVDTSPETATFTVSGAGDLLMTLSSGASIVADGIFQRFITSEAGPARTVDWSAPSPSAWTPGNCATDIWAATRWSRPILTVMATPMRR